MISPETFQFLIGQTFIFGYSGFIALVAVVVWGFFARKARVLTRNLDTASRALPREVSGVGDPSPARAELSKNWTRVAETINGIEGLRHPWSEFVECLIVPPDARREAGAPIRNTRDPAVYFSPDSVIKPHLNLRLYDSMPGILTGLGILGTFVGLAAGIGLAQEGLIQDRIEDVQGALQQLLRGASLAFFTSIVGLSSSIVFLIFERRGVEKLRRKLTLWTHSLDRALERTTPEKVAVHQLEQQTELNRHAAEQLAQLNQQTAELKTFNTELVISIASALDEKVAGRLGPALDRIVAATEAMKEQQATATEDMLQHIVSQFGETMSGAAGREFEAITNSLQGLDDMLKGSLASMREQEERSTAALNRLSGQVAQTLSEGSSQMRKGFQESMEMMMTSTQATLDGFARRFEEMTESTASVATQNSELLGRQIGAAIGRAGGELDAVTARMTEALESAGSAASSRIDQSASSLAEKADGLTRALSEAETITIRLSDAARAVRAATEGVGHVLDGLTTVTPALTSSSSAIKTAGDAITRASSTIGGFGEAATQATRGLNETTQRMQENWKTYVERFEGSDEAMAEVVVQMETGLTSFADRVMEFNRKVDSEFGRAISMLTSAIEDLDTTLEDRAAR